ncbi:MAG: hypothetical protein R3190_10650 [Thermoanaerobaculia bacterium]|nr:hypothetical protein [Thermoanaerobaculia bacterium]
MATEAVRAAVRTAVTGGCLLLAVVTAAAARTPGPRVLVVDLDGDGLKLTDRYYGVDVDVDGDRRRERLTWTSPTHREALLWIDRDGDGGLGPGELIVGAGVRQAGAVPSPLEALAALDLPTLGGNGDGVLSRLDSGWRRLRLWVDANHDGLGQAEELAALGSWAIEALDLAIRPMRRLDGGLNRHLGWIPFRRSRPRAAAGRSYRIVEVELDREG